MLELHDPWTCFVDLEEHLRGHGFFGPRHRQPSGARAEVFLGYAASRTMRRTTAADPPEPLALPIVACRIRDADDRSRPAGDFEVGTWQPTWSEAGYMRAIELTRAAIADGEVYQVNLVQHLSAPFSGDPAGLAGVLARFDPLVPWVLDGRDWAIVSASPELFLARRGDRLWTRPIKGTRAVGGPDAHRALDALQASDKDAAEHVMIVDLERNDLGRVSRPGSVRWPELMAARPMTGVAHLVSTVESEARMGLGLAELLTGLFPGGSVTGAPKVAAIDRIAALEPVGRGASMGALGTIHPNGDLDLALTIRTFAVAAGRIHLWVGGGVVWDSDPAAEVEESWVKARPLLDAIGTSSRQAVRP